MSQLEFESNVTALRYGGERHLADSAVIVLNGHTYHLMVNIDPLFNEVCYRCDLYFLCPRDSGLNLLERLCKECTPKGVGFWVEDRYPIQTTLEEVCNSQSLYNYNGQLACRKWDKPMFTDFDDKY